MSSTNSLIRAPGTGGAAVYPLSGPTLHSSYAPCRAFIISHGHPAPHGIQELWWLPPVYVDGVPSCGKDYLRLGWQDAMGVRAVGRLRSNRTIAPSSPHHGLVSRWRLLSTRPLGQNTTYSPASTHYANYGPFFLHNIPHIFFMVSCPQALGFNVRPSADRLGYVGLGQG